MPETAFSGTEHALETQRIGPLQIRVALLCGLIQTCDGYDLNSIAWAVPSLIKEWHLAAPVFATAFMWSSIGIMVGALAAGPLGDRFGRKPLLLTSLTIFGIASLLSTFAGSLGGLALLRFFTGLGIGGGYSGSASLTGDYAPARRRALMIMASFTGAPLGGFIGGQLVAALLPHFGWQVIFVLGAAFPLLLLPVVAVWLPESPRFLLRRATLRPRDRALLARLDLTAFDKNDHRLDVATGNPVAMLFSKGYALQTILLWTVYFCSLMNLFLFAYWMPTVLNLTGMSPSQAVFASSLRDCGALFAVFYLGVAIDRYGPERSLALHYAAGAVFIAVIALVALPYLLLLIVAFFAGLTITGSQTGANGACGKLYPARMRTSGMGWALGIGRLGGIAAPVLGGWLLSLGFAPTHIFLSSCLFALIAATATALLAYRGTQASAFQVGEAIS
ncbi:MAG: MFS transporter [Alphaproteobacteria bacterium]|nr:MFS transporter [Alphaproteobacteria bacterium]